MFSNRCRGKKVHWVEDNLIKGDRVKTKEEIDSLDNENTKLM